MDNRHTLRHRRAADVATMSAAAASRVFTAPGIFIAHRATRRSRPRGPVRVHASAGARHSGIVGDDLVHGSSLTSTRDTPAHVPPASGAAAGGVPVAAGIAPEDLVHGSSLVATRHAPTKQPASSSSSSTAVAARGSGKPIAYIAPTCPFAHKAWLALVEKEVDFEMRAVDLNDKQPDMIAAHGVASPDAGSVAKVPILVHDGVAMIESALCAEYVADAFRSSGADLSPATPRERYVVGLWCETFAVSAPFFAALRATSQSDVDAALDDLRATLRRCERCLEIAHTNPNPKPKTDGPFVLGAKYSMAEVLTSTMLPRLSVALCHYRGFRLRAAVEEMGLTRLARWMDASMDRPSMRRTLREVGRVKGVDVGSAFIDHFAKFVSWKGE